MCCRDATTLGKTQFSTNKWKNDGKEQTNQLYNDYVEF